MWTAYILASVLTLTIAQDDPAELYAVGVERYNAGEYEQAVDLLSRARALESDIPDYRYHLGLAYLKVGRNQEAARELEAALGMMGMRRRSRSSRRSSDDPPTKMPGSIWERFSWPSASTRTRSRFCAR